MIKFHCPNMTAQVKVQGNIITMPVKTPLHDYYNGGPLRLSGSNYLICFDNPMVFSGVDSESIRDISTSWILDWEKCWSTPVIQHQKDDLWRVKYNLFVLKPDGTGDLDAMKVEHVMPELEFYKAILFALVVGEDSE